MKKNATSDASLSQIEHAMQESNRLSHFHWGLHSRISKRKRKTKTKETKKKTQKLVNKNK